MKRLVYVVSALLGLTCFVVAPRAAPTSARPTPLPKVPGPRVPAGEANAKERAARVAIQATGRPEEIKKIPNAAGVLSLKVRPLKGRKTIRVPLPKMLTFLRRHCKRWWYGLYNDMTEFSKWGFASHECRFTQHEGQEVLETINHRVRQFSFGLKIDRTRFLYATTGRGKLLHMEALHTRKGLGESQVYRKKGGRWVVTRYHLSDGRQTALETKRLKRRPRLTLENGDLALFAWLAQGKARAGDGLRMTTVNPGAPRTPEQSFQVLAVVPRQGPAKSRTWYKVEVASAWKTRSGTATTTRQMLVDDRGTILLIRSHDYRHRLETEAEARWISESVSGAQRMLQATLKRKFSEAALQSTYRLDLRGHPVRSFALEGLSELRLLEELNLNQTLVKDEGLLHLRKLKRLRVLWLKGTKVTPAGVRALRQALPGCKVHFDAPSPPGAKLGKNASVAERLAHWLKGHGVETHPSTVFDLEELLLPEAKVHDSDLARLRRLPKLNTLSLRRSRITNAGLDHLRSLPRLSSLNLSELDITDEGLKRLIPLRDRLSTLDLDGTLVTDAGLRHLTGFTKLKVLRLPVQITKAAAARLKKRLKKVTITRESVPNVVRIVRKDRALHSAATGCQWRLPLGSILVPFLLIFGWLGLLGLIKRPGRPTLWLLGSLLGARSSRLLLVLGGLGLVVTGLSLLRPVRFLSQAKTAQGTVVQLRRTSMTGCMGCSVSATRDRAPRPTPARTTYGGDFGSNYLIVRFQTKAGQTHTFQSRVSGDKSYTRLGRKVEVRYAPGAPKQAMLTAWESYLSLFLTTSLVALLALLLLAAGLVRTVTSRREKGGAA